LRTVLRHQQHAVAAAHAQSLLHVARQRERGPVQFAKARGAPVENDGRLARQAGGCLLQVGEQIGGRNLQRMRDAGRPVRVVSCQSRHILFKQLVASVQP